MPVEFALGTCATNGSDPLAALIPCHRLRFSRTVLSPGDLTLTGPPSGHAGAHGDRWLAPGDDVMEGTITGLGAQRNRCVAPS